MEISKKTLNTSQHTGNLPGGNGAHYSVQLLEKARADNAAEKPKAMVNNTATLVRGGKEEEVSLKMFVPGDSIRLAAGDMVPADVRVLSTKDLFPNQAALTGASDKGAWVRLLHPPIEGRLESGFEGMDVGHGLHVQRVRTNVERGYIDFKRVV